MKIYEITEDLKYPRHFIDKAQSSAKKQFYAHDEKVPFDLRNILTLPYHDNFIELPRILKNFNINVVFKYSNVKSQIIKNSPLCKAACIYEIPCKECNKRYYGQTGKQLAVRLKQHKYSIRTAQTSSALFVHLSNFNHRIDWDQSKELVYCEDIVKRNIIESCLIKFNNANVLNLSPGLFKLDAFIINEVVKMFNFTF